MQAAYQDRRAIKLGQGKAIEGWFRIGVSEIGQQANSDIFSGSQTKHVAAGSRVDSQPIAAISHVHSQLVEFAENRQAGRIIEQWRESVWPCLHRLHWPSPGTRRRTYVEYSFEQGNARPCGERVTSR